MAFCAEEPEAGPEIEELRSATKKYCYIRETSFNNLKDEYELETGSDLTKK